jgi:hypothetical protein
MHYHIELVVPPDVGPKTFALTTVSLSLPELLDMGEGVDCYLHGGRFAGQKWLTSVPIKKLEALNWRLAREQITVSQVMEPPLRFLRPASQAAKVNRIWREVCPEGGRCCPLFRETRKFRVEPWSVGDVPERLRCNLILVVDATPAEPLGIHYVKSEKEPLKLRQELRRIKVPKDWLTYTIDVHH